MNKPESSKDIKKNQARSKNSAESTTKPPVTPEAIEQYLAEIANRRKSHLEKDFGQYHDRTIENASGARQDTGKLMRDFNRVFSIFQGLGTVMRIVAGNDVTKDFYDPEDPDSAVPLGMHAINSLVTLAATVCELMADDISITADSFNGRGEQA